MRLPKVPMSEPTNKTTTDAIARLEKRVEVLETRLREILQELRALGAEE